MRIIIGLLLLIMIHTSVTANNHFIISDDIISIPSKPIDLPLEPATPIIAPNSCCPPWNDNKILSTFTPIFESNADGKYRMHYNNNSDVKNQLQAYINYANSVDPNITSLHIRVRITTGGWSNTLPNSPDLFLNWVAGNPGAFTSGSWNNFELNPNQTYKIYTGIYTGGGTFFSKDNCGNASATISWNITP